MSERGFRWALLGIVLVTIVGMSLDVMEVDAAQYASMSRDMLATADWTQLFHRHENYLDKPPLLFWVSALSFKLFGVHNWSYKLPSVLFAFLGLFATYRFTLLHHAKEVARTAAILFGTSAAFLLMTNDVRCDTILTGSVMMAIWLGAAWIMRRGWWSLAGCAVAIAAGMLAKGPMGLMAPALALGAHVVLGRHWQALRDPRWLAALPIIALLLVPMCIGLYGQHGAHGLRFYFWEQSFGRLTGENRWKDDSTVFFFTHEVVWQLLPWTVFVLIGIWDGIVASVRRRTLPEHASIGGAVLVFIALSFSQFKLPHYLYVVVPLFAVLGARALHNRQQRWPWTVHAVLLALLWIAAVLLVTWSFPEGGWPYAAMLGAALQISALLVKRKGFRNGMMGATIVTMLAIGMAINGHVYPHLLGYQANAQAGKWAAAQHLDVAHFHGLQQSGTSLDFYAGFPVPWISDVEEARAVIAPGVCLYTDVQRLAELRAAGLPPKEVIVLPDYRVQLLGVEMLVPSRRPAVLEERFILRY